MSFRWLVVHFAIFFIVILQLSLVFIVANNSQQPRAVEFTEFSEKMSYSKPNRIPQELFQKDEHYLGRPADFNDAIIARRLNLIRKFPDFLGKNYNLIEIGCGNGASIFGIANEVKTALGLDINSGHFAKINQYKAENNIKNCDFIACDIEKNASINKFKGKFDRLICFEVIEHLRSDNSIAIFDEMLKTGGMIAITVPNKWWIFETHGAKLPVLPWNRVPFFSWLPKIIHEKFANARIYTKKRIKNLLESHGFKILSIEYVTAPLDVLPRGKFKDFIVNFFFPADTTVVPFKATSIFIIARSAK